MTASNLPDVFDGAKHVSFTADGLTAVVWHGGVTFNVYAVDPGNNELHATTCFSVSDVHGEPVDPAEAEAHAENWLESQIVD